MRKFRLVGLGRTPQATGPETTASLLAAGLDARAAELASATPLQRAAAEGHVDIVHQLLKHGADVNHQDAVHGNSALHEAAWRGYSQTATILVRHQKTSSNYCCNVNAVNRAGFTPLHLCCQNGHNETCRVLLIANASPNVKNHYGDTPLHTSGRYGHAGVMRILLSANCNVAEQNKNGDTALHIAAAMGRRKLTRILLGAGCPINIKNKQGELAVDIARRKEFHEIVTMLQKGPLAAGKSSSKSRSASSGKKREKGGTTGSAASSSRDSSSKQRHKERKRQKKEKSSNGHVTTSPYGCHANPELAKRLHPKLNSLPNEPLRQGEQYYLDLAGNIQKGPVGVQTCYCGPVLHRLECRLAKDKQDILQRLDSAHLRLDARIDGLERKTQLQLQGLQRTVDSLGLESSPAGIQRVRNSIVLADPGHTTPPLPSLDFMSSSSHSQYGSDAEEEDARNNNNNKQPNEVQYTLDKLGLDMTDGKKQPGLQALRDRLALTRIREQKELDDIVENYERRHVTIKEEEAQVEIHQEEEDSEESEDEEVEEVNSELPPVLDSGKCASMMSDSRYENYDYPPNKTSSGTNGISYRNLPLPRYHLDPVLETNGTTVDHKSPIPSGLTVIDPVNSNRVSQQQHFVVPIYHHEDRDRHNDSGYSTRPGESSQGPSPSLSAGPAESVEGEHHHPVLMSPRSIRRSELFQSHFARDLAQTLPSHPTGTSATSNGVGPAYPRVRFAVPNEHESLLFPPGTISSSSLV